jgi:hypothetical protein
LHHHRHGQSQQSNGDIDGGGFQQNPAVGPGPFQEVAKAF